MVCFKQIYTIFVSSTVTRRSLLNYNVKPNRSIFMKNFKILLVFAAAVAILSSCNKEYAEPTIAWTPDVLSHYVDLADATTYNVDLAMTFTAEAGITNIEVWKHITQDGTEVSVTMAAPTGYDGLTTFDYNFVSTNVEADFDGVSEIVYEFIVTDASETPQLAKKEYIITNVIPDVYTVTFNVVDEADVAITDAIVTFNGTTNAVGVYTFADVETGTYEYTIAKDGFVTETVSDYVMGEADATIAVTLVEELSAWSENVLLGLQAYAVYEGTNAPNSENETIGFDYTANNGTGTAAVVNKLDDCEGWVEVNNADYTTVAQIQAAYTDGLEITTAELGFDYEAKAFSERFFISKMGEEYILVKYVAGVVCPNNHTSTTGNYGNVLVFQYKD